MSEAPLTDVRLGSGRRTAVLAIVFGAIAVLTGADLVLDAGEGASFAHMAAEGSAMLVGVTGLAMMLRELATTRRRAAHWQAESSTLSSALDDETARSEALAERLDATRAEAQHWQREARSLLDGLGAAIDRQFDRWGATRAEKEVGLLLLKGLSHKDVARIRGTSDATARQQARSLYQKAGLTGRNDLSAFFLEDLLLPIDTPPTGD